MKTKLPILQFLLLVSALSCKTVASDTIKIGNTDLVVDTIYSGLDIPWEIKLASNNQLWVTERLGQVSRIDPVNGTRKVVLNISSEVYAAGESGLLGMALHPEFPEIPEIFLVYTYINGQVFERLVKYELENDSLINGKILIDSITAGTNHNGSRLLFLPDGSLLMTTGDALQQNLSQDSGSLNGKVLRLLSNGGIPNDNPGPGYIYSIGHRNAQGICLGPNASIFISEHGPNSDDEFQELVPGANYGWPAVHGFCDKAAEITFCNDNTVQEPIRAWTPTIAPSDLVYYNSSVIPEFSGRFLMTTLKNKQLYALKLNEEGDSVLSENIYLSNMFGRLRDIEPGPNGSIYLATNGPDWGNSQPFTHYIIRLRSVNMSSIGRAAMLPPHLQIYPNPMKDILHIKVDANAEYLVKISNMKGELLFEGLNTEMVSGQEFSRGIYLVTVQVGDLLLRRRISVL